MRRAFFGKLAASTAAPVAAALILAFVAGCAAPKAYHKQTPATSAVQSQSFMIPSADILPSNIIPQAATIPVYHTVHAKETLWRISKQYHVPLNEVMAANQIRDARQIKIGQRLLIPGVTRSATYNFVMPYLPPADHWKYIVVHHTATREGNGETINALHLRRGWKEGMGYHFLIDNGTDGRADGEIEAGRRWQRQMDGAHSNKSNMNHLGIGISLVGNFSEVQVSEAQLTALVQLTKSLQQRYGIPLSNVISHRDVPGAATECPGNNFPWKRFTEMLKRIN
jgi:hypothetical protein